jgi:hypothetical protein
MEEINNPRLTRKFDKWKAKNLTRISFLIQSLMHPISRIRLESQVAVIRLKELRSGFRVLSAEAALIDNLSDISIRTIRENIFANNSNYPETVICHIICVIETIYADSNYQVPNAFGFGDYSDLAAIQDEASIEYGREVELIQMLNRVRSSDE